MHTYKHANIHTYVHTNIHINIQQAHIINDLGENVIKKNKIALNMQQ